VDSTGGQSFAEALEGAVVRRVIVDGEDPVAGSFRFSRKRLIGPPRLGVVAEGPGYALSATGEIALVMPLEESPASRLLSLMHGGEAWSASSLALALDVSERTVQRSLGELQTVGKVGPTGNGRGRRWVRLFEIPTDLLLPPRRPAP